jgi:hypothetical protein
MGHIMDQSFVRSLCEKKAHAGERVLLILECILTACGVKPQIASYIFIIGRKSLNKDQWYDQVPLTMATPRRFAK